MQLVRWTLRPADVDDFLVGPIRTLTRDPGFLALIAGFYVSRQPAGVVWLTIYTQDAGTEAARKDISRRLGEQADEPGLSIDPILADEIAWYRRVLQQVCETALDLIPVRVEEARLLRLIRDPGEKPFYPDPPPGEGWRSLLEQPLLERAEPYRALDRSARDQLWHRFAEWPAHAFLSPAGHWLWNITGLEPHA